MQTFSGYNIKVMPPYIYEEERQVKSQQAYVERYERPLNEDLQINMFKIYPCQQKTQHNHKQCRFYHSNKDRRRSMQLESSELCRVAQKHIKNQQYDFTCPDGEHCRKCHNKVEQLYSIEKYKTKFCTHYPHDCQNCQYGEYCSFAHRENEIRMELIHHYERDIDFFVFHYKTLWCPFNYLKHDRSHCVYAHNWQDYRRKPNIYMYEHVSCPKWNPNNFITKYETQCSNQMACQKCHGWKELQYHPKNYKTRQCSNGNKCPKGDICPYYHNNNEKRKFSQKIKSGFFNYYPRNRRVCRETHTSEDYRNQLNKTSSELDENSDCSSEASIVGETHEDTIIEEMVQKIIGTDDIN